MSHFISFCLEIKLVVFVRFYFDGNIFDYFEAIANESCTFFGIVAKQFYFAKS